KRLVGYVVSEGDFDKETVQSELKESLPEYMVPRVWVELEAMPLTSSGKLDRKALPEPDGSLLSTKEYVAPRNKVEADIARIWQEVLGLDKVGVYDNFFELGGHSLLMVQVNAGLQKAGHHITVKDIFSNPTVAEISKKVFEETLVYTVPENGIKINTNYITPAMVPLLEVNQENIDTIVANIPSGVENIQDIYPLSPLQEGMHFHYLMSKKDQGDPYIMSNLLSFENKEKRNSFIEALQFVVNRHDVLRTCIISEGLPNAVQVVLREAQLKVEELEIESSKEVLPELELLRTPGNQRMDISKAPLLALKSADDLVNEKYYLLVNQHHLVLDHVGMEKITSEVMSYLSGQQSNLPDPVLYRDFIGHTLHAQTNNDSESYFKNLLGNITEPTYPFELSDTLGSGSNINEEEMILPTELSKRIRSVCIELGMSPAVLFHAAYGLIIGKCSNSDYAVFGTLFSGRLQGVLGATDSLGLFINTLPFFTELKGSITEYIQKVKKGLHELLPYEQTPLSSVQNWSNISNEVPLFSALLNFRHSLDPRESEDNSVTADLGITLLDGHERTNYPFTLNVDDYGVDFGLTAQLEASIEPERILSYIEITLVQLLDGLNNEMYVENISIVSPEEEQEILEVFNDTTLAYPSEKTVVELFTAQVEKTPEAVAISFEGTTLTYAALDQRSNQLAHYLRDQGIQPDMLVGICMDRSLELLVGILGVLKSGGAYVPIDSGYPEERIEYMLNDASIN
ncbi:condensation domain-containing protein, partial [Tenacibaculum agarivorans]|uniref:condensation domain-containing protein n=1 Tax=Tenacibaculum agarivorans TaxID=1908389 RepID=UPI000B21D8B9